jgi:threonine/homoserine/homoserine lactone efflux protein
MTGVATMFWAGGIALISLAVLTMLGLVPIPKVMITLEFFSGLYLIYLAFERRDRQKRGGGRC